MSDLKPEVGDLIELIGSYFDFPLRIDWNHGAKGKIVAIKDGLFEIQLFKHSGINNYKFSRKVFRVLIT